VKSVFGGRRLLLLLLVGGRRDGRRQTDVDVVGVAANGLSAAQPQTAGFLHKTVVPSVLLPLNVAEQPRRLLETRHGMDGHCYAFF
jgi:hypothetical protein